METLEVEADVGSWCWRLMLEVDVGSRCWKWMLEVDVGSGCWKWMLEVEDIFIQELELVSYSRMC
jgi:hypothetical protein